MQNKQSNTVGIVLILIGVYLVGNIFFDWDFSIFFDGWWTLFIIIPSALSLKKNGVTPKAITGLCIGLALFLSARDIIPFWTIIRLAVPLALIGWGLSIVFANKTSHKRIADGNVLYKDGCPEYSAIFSHQKITCNNEVYVGATCNAIFGSVEMDLRNAYINEDVAMSCSSIFGGMTVRVPSDVNVRVSCVPIFGGVDNRLIKRNIPGAPTLYINATCMFGGLDIR